jgi:hypothetical protein
MCVKYCLYVFTNMATVEKYEVRSDKNSVGPCRNSYFHNAFFRKVAYIQLQIVVLIIMMIIIIIKLYVSVSQNESVTTNFISLFRDFGRQVSA